MAVGVSVNPDWAPCGQCDCLDGVSPIPNKWEIRGVLVTNECPRRSVPADANAIMEIVQHYLNGHLWSEGGVSQQPAIYLEMMRLITYWAEELKPK
mgnify:CR=1 FL=1